MMEEGRKNKRTTEIGLNVLAGSRDISIYATRPLFAVLTRYLHANSSRLQLLLDEYE